MRRLLPLIVLAVTACSGGGSAHVHPSNTSMGQPDRPIAGPQGAVPQFVVDCEFSHLAPDDPIVYPGEPGESHLHAFFGNTATDANSTALGLVGGETTCDQPADAAAYWVPTLFRGGEPLQPVKSTAYYRPGIDVDPKSVQAFPAGFQMVAGNAGAEGPQPVSIVAWSCGAGIERSVEPPVCTQDRQLRLLVTFPDCWDGKRLDSDDHHAHVAYSSGGRCPESHAVPVPQLQFSVEYPVWGDTAGLELASGGLLSGHADFMNGWDQRRLETEVRLCLHREVVCGVASGRISG